MNKHVKNPMYGGKKKSNEKRKIFSDLKPLCLADFQEPRAKVKKTESVRKGLFTKPAVTNGNQPSRVSLAKRNSITRSNPINNKVQALARRNPSLSSPLLNLEEVEEEILTKKASLRGYPFKSPSRPAFNFSKPALKSKPLNIPKIIMEEPTQTTNESNNNENYVDVNQNIKDKEPKTPDSHSSSEFLKFEEMCVDSPVTSMCNLLQDTGLNSIRRPKLCPNMKGGIETMIVTLENILQSEQTAFKLYQQTHEQNISNLRNLLASCKKQVPETNKENSPVTNHRRSIRLLNKSPSRLNNDKLLVSPRILKSGDLRKSTLKKNLAAKNKQYSMHSNKCSPIELFKKSKQPILETPKADRKGLLVGESPGMRYVSMLVETQCQMLQDTPVHK